MYKINRLHGKQIDGKDFLFYVAYYDNEGLVFNDGSTRNVIIDIIENKERINECKHSGQVDVCHYYDVEYVDHRYGYHLYYTRDDHKMKEIIKNHQMNCLDKTKIRICTDYDDFVQEAICIYNGYDDIAFYIYMMQKGLNLAKTEFGEEERANGIFTTVDDKGGIKEFKINSTEKDYSLDFVDEEYQNILKSPEYLKAKEEEYFFINSSWAAQVIIRDEYVHDEHFELFNYTLPIYQVKCEDTTYSFVTSSYNLPVGLEVYLKCVDGETRLGTIVSKRDIDPLDWYAIPKTNVIDDDLVTINLDVKKWYLLHHVLSENEFNDERIAKLALCAIDIDLNEEEWNSLKKGDVIENIKPFYADGGYGGCGGEKVMVFINMTNYRAFDKKAGRAIFFDDTYKFFVLDKEIINDTKVIALVQIQDQDSLYFDASTITTVKKHQIAKQYLKALRNRMKKGSNNLDMLGDEIDVAKAFEINPFTRVGRFKKVEQKVKVDKSPKISDFLKIRDDILGSSEEGDEKVIVKGSFK